MVVIAYAGPALWASPGQQTGGPAPSPPGPQQSSEAIILDRITSRATFEADGSGVRDDTVSARILSEAGVKALAILLFSYTSGDQDVAVDYVRVRKPDGTVVVTPPYNIQDLPEEVTLAAPMYSDLREKHVAVKALGVGDTLEYHVRISTSRPQVPGHFWFTYNFSRQLITNEEELEVDVPRSVTLNLSSPQVRPLIREEGRRRIYTWRTSNPRRATAEQSGTGMKGEAPSVGASTFRSWEDVSRWYASLQRPALAATPAILAKVQALTAGLSSDEEKIRALYGFVSTKIHFVSLSFGLGRFKPHAADEVLSNEYGDCKDKHTLLAALLRAAGYEVWPALVSSHGSVDPAVPSPGQFDHVITVVRTNGQLTWLDSTSGVAPYGMLFAPLRESWALVVRDDRPQPLTCTPADPPWPLVTTVTVTAELSGEGVLVGHFEQTDRSDREMLLRGAFRSVPRSNWQDVVQQISYSNGFAGTTSNVEASFPDDTTLPFWMSWDYTRHDYGDWPNRQVIVPLPPVVLPMPSSEPERPVQSIPLGPPSETLLSATMVLPPGYTLTTPKPVDLASPYADYHARYSLIGHTLICERQLTIKALEVDPAHLDDYRDFVKAIGNDWGGWMRLQDATAVTTAAPGGNPEAEPLFTRAMTALQRGDQGSAEADLLRVLQIDPVYPRAHLVLGGVYLNKRQSEQGLNELRKEVELHPTDVWALTACAEALKWSKRTDEAIGVWKKVLDVEPGHLTAALSLGELLIKAKRCPEAIRALEPAAARNPNNADLQERLGYAYLAGGQSDKSLPALKKAIELDPSANRMNEVAYGMIEANGPLGQAKEWARAAVAKAEADSVATTLSGLKLDDLDRVNLISRAWDTLGWVYFRTGELEKAERYLRAAWSLSQDATMGVHLARLYERQGKRSQAALTYELASAGEDAADEPDIAEEYRRLTGRPLGSSVPSPDRYNSPASPGEALLRARMFRLLTVTKETATADFFLLMVPGSKTAEVKFVSGSAILRDSAEDIAAAAGVADFPDEGPVKLIRRGTVSCGPAGCDLVLLTPAMVRSLE